MSGLIDELNDAIRLREVALEAKEKADQNAKRLADLLSAEKQKVHNLSVELNHAERDLSQLKTELSDARRKLEHFATAERLLVETSAREQEARQIAEEMVEMNENMMEERSKLKARLQEFEAEARAREGEREKAKAILTVFQDYLIARNDFDSLIKNLG